MNTSIILIKKNLHCDIVMYIFIFIIICCFRLEAKSEKAPRNHFRENGMLGDGIHVRLLKWSTVNIFQLDAP